MKDKIKIAVTKEMKNWLIKYVGEKFIYLFEINK